MARGSSLKSVNVAPDGLRLRARQEIPSRGQRSHYVLFTAMNKPASDSAKLLIPRHLKFEDVSGSGLQIHAFVDERVSFVEYAMRPGYKTVLEAAKHSMVAYGPWTGPFTPMEWDDMMRKLFNEMVDAWNEKHSNTLGEKP